MNSDTDSSTPLSRTETWESMFEQFRAYVRTHGDSYIPIRYPSNASLGRWVDNQRHQYRLLLRGQPSRMTAERLEKLTALGMAWDPRDKVWENWYEKLVQYKEIHGHVNPPKYYEGGLGRWVYYQRSQYRYFLEGEVSSMTQERAERLNALGMVWSIHSASWDESYRLLQEFYKQHGHANVPTDPDNALSVWVQTQRREYKLYKEGKHSQMAMERIERLDKLNFQWDYQEAIWLEKYKELCRYREEHGNWCV